MSTLAELTSPDKIENILCRLRVGIANQRNKEHLIHLHSKDEEYNYHTRPESETKIFICSLFPPRKKWRQPGFTRRFNGRDSKTTSDKNLISLRLTLRYFRKEHPNELFLKRLDNYVQEIREAIHGDVHRISRPYIIPSLKEDVQSDIEPNICRPLASYGLKDKIIISIINKYLVKIFDPIFSPESFAFRSKRQFPTEERCPTHQDSIQQILNYRERFCEGSIYVSECDMKKFFDTVSHSVVKSTFRSLLKRTHFRQYDVNDLLKAKRVLYQYLESYTFNKLVLPLNKNQDFFAKFNIKNGEFGWVESELIENKFYKKISAAKIGVPQGGALSGFIANLVLHSVDQRVLRFQDASLLYVRFCDDMMILHPNRSVCELAFNSYLNGISSKKLVAHIHVMPPFDSKKEFWRQKSKKCYLWGGDHSKGSPWIAFVGYEIHYKGFTRVRKSSLNKEMKKQQDTTSVLRKLLFDPKRRSSGKAIYESAANRLIGMSIGRVSLWNYRTQKNEMCWINGFTLLNDNKYSAVQLKRLDRSRSKLLRYLKRKSAALDKTDKVEESNKDRSISKQKIYYGRPFSYYYHVISKKKSDIKSH